MNRMEYMKPQIDCLLIAYSGLIDQKSMNVYKRMMSENSLIKDISKPLNAAIPYLGSSLDANGFSFEFINSIADETGRLINLLQTYEIGSIGITTTNYQDIKSLIKLITLIREINYEIPIILGGAFIVNYVRILAKKSEKVMQNALKALKADFIVDSIYGEEKLAAIISRLKNGLPVHDISNLYVNEEGRFYCTEKKEEVYVLQEKKINWQLFKGRTGNMATIRTSVSCPFRCKFCTYPMRAGKYNAINTASMERELNGIQELGEVSLIQIVDDTFNISPKRFKDILKMMIRNQYSFKWYAYIRCETLDEETVRLMKDSGCIGVILGIESGSDIMLKSMNKQVTASQYRKSMKLLKDHGHGIAIVASFFIGFPGETNETVEETYRFIEETKPDFHHMLTWEYDIRSPIHDEKEQHDLKGNASKWSHRSMDSETAKQLAAQMKQKIKSSTLLEGVNGVNYTFLFQMLNTDMTLSQIKNAISRASIKDEGIAG